MNELTELLPVGSVVLLKEATRKTIIMGIFQFNAEKPDKVYTYLGVPYPEGYMGKGSSYLFNHENIESIIQRGYEDDERQTMLDSISHIYQEADRVINSIQE